MVNEGLKKEKGIRHSTATYTLLQWINFTGGTAAERFLVGVKSVISKLTLQYWVYSDYAEQNLISEYLWCLLEYWEDVLMVDLEFRQRYSFYDSILSWIKFILPFESFANRKTFHVAEDFFTVSNYSGNGLIHGLLALARAACAWGKYRSGK